MKNNSASFVNYHFHDLVSTGFALTIVGPLMP